MKNLWNKKGETKVMGIGFFGLLTLMFIYLKLTGTIGWSWWWVLAPLWAPFALFIVVFVCIFIGALILEVIKRK